MWRMLSKQLLNSLCKKFSLLPETTRERERLCVCVFMLLVGKCQNTHMYLPILFGFDFCLVMYRTGIFVCICTNGLQCHVQSMPWRTQNDFIDFHKLNSNFLGYFLFLYINLCLCVCVVSVSECVGRSVCACFFMSVCVSKQIWSG